MLRAQEDPASGQSSRSLLLQQFLRKRIAVLQRTRGRLMARLGARTVAELTRIALQEGPIAPTEPPPPFENW